MPTRVRDLKDVHKGPNYTFTWESSTDLHRYSVDKAVEGETIHITVPNKTGDNLGLHISPDRPDWGGFHVFFDDEWNVPFDEHMTTKAQQEANAWYEKAKATLEQVANEFYAADAHVPQDNNAGPQNNQQQYVPQHNVPQYNQQQYVPQFDPQQWAQQQYAQQLAQQYNPYAVPQYGQQFGYGYVATGTYTEDGLFIPPQPPQYQAAYQHPYQQPPQQQEVPLDGRGLAAAGVYVPNVGTVYPGQVSYEGMTYYGGMVLGTDNRHRAATQTDLAAANGTQV